MNEGTITRLIHLAAQTELPSANIAPGHNYHGYGYLESNEGVEVYFDHSVVSDRRFEELSEGTRVDYELDDSCHDRATLVALRNEPPSSRD